MEHCHFSFVILIVYQVLHDPRDGTLHLFVSVAYLIVYYGVLCLLTFVPDCVLWNIVSVDFCT